MEANQLGGGPAVGHGPLRMGGKRYDATLSLDKFPLCSVLFWAARNEAPVPPHVLRNSAGRSRGMFTRCPPPLISSPAQGPACQRGPRRAPAVGTSGIRPSVSLGAVAHTPP